MGPDTGASAVDRLGAQDVIVRYAASIDERDFEALRTCFEPDVEIHGFGGEVLHGSDAGIAFVRKALAPFEATQHMLGPPSVELRRDEATLRTELQAQHFFREPRGQIFTLWGRYRSALVRSSDGWRMQRHALHIIATRTTSPDGS